MKHESTNEPVGWITNNGDGWLRWHRAADNNLNSIPLYTHPQDQKKDEALRLALEALDKLTDAAQGFGVSGVYFNEEKWNKNCLDGAYNAITLIEQALENK